MGYLSEAELREISKHPLVTVGAHGLWHRHFTRLPTDEARVELVESRRFASRAITGTPVDLMAWPYGECNAAVEELSKESGIRAAWSVWQGTNSMYSRRRVPLGRRRQHGSIYREGVRRLRVNESEMASAQRRHKRNEDIFEVCRRWRSSGCRSQPKPKRRRAKLAAALQSFRLMMKILFFTTTLKSQRRGTLAVDDSVTTRSRAALSRSWSVRSAIL